MKSPCQALTTIYLLWLAPPQPPPPHPPTTIGLRATRKNRLRGTCCGQCEVKTAGLVCAHTNRHRHTQKTLYGCKCCNSREFPLWIESSVLLDKNKSALFEGSDVTNWQIVLLLAGWTLIKCLFVNWYHTLIITHTHLRVAQNTRGHMYKRCVHTEPCMRHFTHINWYL